MLVARRAAGPAGSIVLCLCDSLLLLRARPVELLLELALLDPRLRQELWSSCLPDRAARRPRPADVSLHVVLVALVLTVDAQP